MTSEQQQQEVEVRTDVEVEWERGHLASSFQRDPNNSGYFYICTTTNTTNTDTDTLSPPDTKSFLSDKCAELWDLCSIEHNIDGDDNDDDVYFKFVPGLVDDLKHVVSDLRKYKGGKPVEVESSAYYDGQRIANAMNAMIAFQPLLESLVFIGSAQHSNLETRFFEKYPDLQTKVDKKGKQKLYSAFFLAPIVAGHVKSVHDDGNNQWVVGLVKGKRMREFHEMVDLISFAKAYLDLDLHQHKHLIPGCPLSDKVDMDSFSRRKNEMDRIIELVLDEHRSPLNDTQQILYLYQNLSSLLSNTLTSQNPCVKATLSIYGSSFSQLAIQGSDCDFSLDFSHKHTGEILSFASIDPKYGNLDDNEVSEFKQKEDTLKIVKRQIYKLINILRKKGYIDLVPVPFARIPVISARCPRTSIAFDICMDNARAVENSTLLKEYASLDNRVRDLILLVKVWAKANRIGSARFSMLSSYSWSILVIFFLQRIDFVPNLQCHSFIKAHQSLEDICVDSRCDKFLSAIEVLSAGIWKPPNSTITISSLLFGFFSFYHTKYDSKHFTISVRLANKADLIKGCFEKSSRIDRMSIEDPFETCSSIVKHDLGVHMNDFGQIQISKCIENAFTLFEQIFSQDLDIKLIRRIFNPCAKEKGKKPIWKSPTPQTFPKKNNMKQNDQNKISQKNGTPIRNHGRKPKQKEVREGKEPTIQENSTKHAKSNNISKIENPSPMKNSKESVLDRIHNIQIQKDETSKEKLKKPKRRKKKDSESITQDLKKNEGLTKEIKDSKAKVVQENLR